MKGIIAVCKSYRKRQEKHNISNTLHTHTLARARAYTHAHTHACTYALVRKCNEHNLFAFQREATTSLERWPLQRIPRKRRARGEHVFTCRLSLRRFESRTGRISIAKTPKWRRLLDASRGSCFASGFHVTTSMGFDPLGIPVPGNRPATATRKPVGLWSESWDSGTTFS